MLSVSLNKTFPSFLPFSLSEWSLTILCLTPYNRKKNVLSASLNKTFPSFLPVHVRNQHVHIKPFILLSVPSPLFHIICLGVTVTTLHDLTRTWSTGHLLTEQGVLVGVVTAVVVAVTHVATDNADVRRGALHLARRAGPRGCNKGCVTGQRSCHRSKFSSNFRKRNKIINFCLDPVGMFFGDCNKLGEMRLKLYE